MDDFTVARADAGTEAACGFQHQHFPATQCQGSCNRKPDHSCADDDAIHAVHGSTAHHIAPKHRYLSCRYSSSPYLEPSRPMPLSLTPPNGATSVEMMPSLIPTMPDSSASATRQTRRRSS